MIVQCVNNLDLGGLERMVLSLAKQLKIRGYGSSICCIENRGALADEAERSGIVVHTLHARETGQWRAINRLNQLLNECHPNVFHSHNFKPFYYGAIARLRGAADVHVHTRHGAFTKVHRAHWRYRLLRPWIDELVTVSEDGRRQLANQTGLNAAHIGVVVNGVDTDCFHPSNDRAAARRALAVPVDDCLILAAARFSIEKNLETLLQAFALVAVEHSKARLWLVGDGPERQMLEGLAHQLGIDSKIRFFGFRNDVAELLRAADVFTLTSLSEGLSVALLEAAASGLPIVATDVGGNREIVNPPECGLIVPPRDPRALAAAYLQLLRDPATCAQIGTRARARIIDQFSLQRMVEEYSRLYKQLLTEKGRD